MKLIAFYICIFLCHFSLVNAQDETWLPVSDIASGVSIYMPNPPLYEKEDLFSKDGKLKKEIFYTSYKGVALFFESQQIFGEGKKANKEAIAKSLKLLAIQNQGVLGKKQVLKKDGFTYNYIEIPLASGDLIRSVIFVFNNRLINIYIKGSIQEAFDAAANYYLANWTLPNVVETIDKSNVVETVEVEEQIKFDWITVAADNGAKFEFPGRPFKKETFIERGNSDIVLTTFSYAALNEGLSYIVTKRDYGNDEGQITDEALYTFLIDRVVENKKIKKIKEIETTAGKQMVFSRGIRFYRLKLIRVEDTMYQFLVKGKRKSIYSAPSEYFFNQSFTHL